LQQAQHRLAALKTQTSGVDLRQQPAVRLAVAALRKAYLDLRRTRIVAPVAGYVARRTVQVGQEVHPGTPLMALVPLDQLWVVANFKETQLAHMRIGQPVTVTSDLYGGSVTYHGRVAGIGAGTGSVFELLPPQNATGNWIKVVQRVPVRIVLDAGEQERHPLRLGLSLHVTVNVHDTRGAVLAGRTVSQPLYHTDVYHQQLVGLQQLITHIIDANAGDALTAGGPGHGG
ncbi:MAG: efflux RND transporter periplasmic adaptor subunit, partial [Solirubrobacteraceae bacterium]